MFIDCRNMTRCHSFCTTATTPKLCNPNPIEDFLKKTCAKTEKIAGNKQFLLFQSFIFKFLAQLFSETT